VADIGNNTVTFLSKQETESQDNSTPIPARKLGPTASQPRAQHNLEGGKFIGPAAAARQAQLTKNCLPASSSGTKTLLHDQALHSTRGSSSKSKAGAVSSSPTAVRKQRSASTMRPSDLCNSPSWYLDRQTRTRLD
jgi:hypothetical protein